MYDVARSVEVRCGGFHLYFCVLVFSFSMCDLCGVGVGVGVEVFICIFCALFFIFSFLNM